MTVTAEKIQSHHLTYEDYMAEPEIMARYDILDGTRVFMTQPSDQHQVIIQILGALFRQHQLSAKDCKSFISLCDVLITRTPLRTRQPDVMVISLARSAGRARRDVSPFSPAPELVVEVLSPSETRSMHQSKLRDYCSVDVKECWVVNIESETIEVLRLTSTTTESVAVYSAGQFVESLTFPGLIVAVNDIFEIE